MDNQFYRYLIQCTSETGPEAFRRLLTYATIHSSSVRLSDPARRIALGKSMEDFTTHPNFILYYASPNMIYFDINYDINSVQDRINVGYVDITGKDKYIQPFSIF